MRDKVLDSIKGICLAHMILLHICIIYGAVSFNGDGAGFYFHIMSFFMIPFYVISGYFFSSKKNFQTFVAHKAKSLFLPWAFWSLISIPIYYVYDYIKDSNVDWLYPMGLLKSIVAFNTNDALWFLFSLFCVNVIYYILHSRFEKRINIIVICIFLISIIECYKLPNILSSSNITLGLVYFHIGQTIRKINFNRSNSRLNYVLAFVALILFVSIYQLDKQYLMFVSLSQFEGCYLLNIPYSLLGSYLLYCICKGKVFQMLFSWIGKNSIVFYVWHMIPLRYIIDPVVKYYYPNIYLLPYIAVSGGVIIISSIMILKVTDNKYSYILGK